MIGQVPIPELQYGPYSSRLREWSTAYPAVLTVERDSDTGFRYIVIEDTAAVGVPDSLCDLLGISAVTVLDYLDEMVVQDDVPPGDKLINRLYFTVTVDSVELYVVPWQYLYRTVEELGSSPG